MGLDKMRIRLLAAVMAVTLVLAGLGGWAVWSNHKAHAKAVAAAQAPAKGEEGRREGPVDGCRARCAQGDGHRMGARRA